MSLTTETLLNTITDNNDTSNDTNRGLPYDESPDDVKQAILIFRLVLLALGIIGSSLIIFIYIKCSNIITTRLGVYIINLTIAFLIDIIDIIIWSLKQFGHDYNTYGKEYTIPKEVIQLAEIPQLGLPTTSIFFALMIIDRFFATCFSRCYKSCYGAKANAIVLSILFWLGSFFLSFILIYRDLLFPYEQLHTTLRFLITYIGPFVIKLLLAIVLVVKRKMVPDVDESQAFIERHRRALYYTITIVIIHLLLSLPYYILQTNIYFKLIAISIDEWIVFLCYTITEVPLVLNPIFCLAMHPEFRDSLVSVCTCSGRAHRDTGDACNDHPECQPLAPLATSPIAEEKEHLDEAEN